MALSNSSLLLISTCLLASIVGSRALICYVCDYAQTNEECNDEDLVNCENDQVCEGYVKYYHDGRMRITKQCQDRTRCRGINEQYCQGSRDQKCYYCCDRDYCNQGLDYASTTTMVSSTTTPTPTTCVGPPGPKGDAGLPGYDGLPGTPGMKGIPGLPGADGMPGFKGRKGDMGLPGSPGARGESGRPGPKGSPGFPGLMGMKGDRGMPGLTGMPGLDGLPGIKGVKGDHGLPGLAGFKGEMGVCECEEPQSSSCELIAFSGVAYRVEQPESDTDPILHLEEVTSNVGGAFSEDTSVFTAPIEGVYAFTATAIANGNGVTPLLIYHNDDVVARTGRSDDDSLGPFPIGTNFVLLTLTPGDEVTLRIEGREGSWWDDVLGSFKDPSDVTFSGYLVAPIEGAKRRNMLGNKRKLWRDV